MADGRAGAASGEAKCKMYARVCTSRKNDLNLRKNNLKIRRFSTIIEQDIL